MALEISTKAYVMDEGAIKYKGIAEEAKKRGGQWAQK
jgi:ABC-type branched-subunit amino acid transport system ATPase component